MELDITHFVNNAAPKDYSASVMEIGTDAAEETWYAACEASDEYLLLDTDEKREAFKAHVRDFGAWDEEEIEAWSDIELNALCIQLIAGDMRECDIGPNTDWELVEQGQSAGRLPGNILLGSDGHVYYSL